MTSDDKVLCPWCGAEMHATGGYHEAMWTGHMTCMGCGANGPRVRSLCGGETVIGKARAAALRRYTPPLKPMTLEEVWREDAPMWVEGKSGALWIGDFYASMDTRNAWEVQTFGSAKPRLLLEDYYNKNWRCWARKPTDEERSAAEWETSRQE